MNWTKQFLLVFSIASGLHSSVFSDSNHDAQSPVARSLFGLERQKSGGSSGTHSQNKKKSDQNNFDFISHSTKPVEFAYVQTYTDYKPDNQKNSDYEIFNDLYSQNDQKQRDATFGPLTYEHIITTKNVYFPLAGNKYVIEHHNWWSIPYDNSEKSAFEYVVTDREATFPDVEKEHMLESYDWWNTPSDNSGKSSYEHVSKSNVVSSSEVGKEHMMRYHDERDTSNDNSIESTRELLRTTHKPSFPDVDKKSSMKYHNWWSIPFDNLERSIHGDRRKVNGPLTEYHDMWGQSYWDTPQNVKRKKQSKEMFESFIQRVFNNWDEVYSKSGEASIKSRKQKPKENNYFDLGLFSPFWKKANFDEFYGRYDDNPSLLGIERHIPGYNSKKSLENQQSALESFIQEELNSLNAYSKLGKTSPELRKQKPKKDNYFDLGLFSPFTKKANFDEFYGRYDDNPSLSGLERHIPGFNSKKSLENQQSALESFIQEELNSLNAYSKLGKASPELRKQKPKKDNYFDLGLFSPFWKKASFDDFYGRYDDNPSLLGIERHIPGYNRKQSLEDQENYLIGYDLPESRDDRWDFSNKNRNRLEELLEQEEYLDRELELPYIEPTQDRRVLNMDYNTNRNMFREQLKLPRDSKHYSHANLGGLKKREEYFDREMNHKDHYKPPEHLPWEVKQYHKYRQEPYDQKYSNEEFGNYGYLLDEYLNLPWGDRDNYDGYLQALQQLQEYFENEFYKIDPLSPEFLNLPWDEISDYEEYLQILADQEGLDGEFNNDDILFWDELHNSKEYLQALQEEKEYFDNEFIKNENLLQEHEYLSRNKSLVEYLQALEKQNDFDEEFDENENLLEENEFLPWNENSDEYLQTLEKLEDSDKKFDNNANLLGGDEYLPWIPNFDKYLQTLKEQEDFYGDFDNNENLLEELVYFPWDGIINSDQYLQALQKEKYSDEESDDNNNMLQEIVYSSKDEMDNSSPYLQTLQDQEDSFDGEFDKNGNMLQEIVYPPRDEIHNSVEYLQTLLEQEEYSDNELSDEDNFELEEHLELPWDKKHHPEENLNLKNKTKCQEDSEAPLVVFEKLTVTAKASSSQTDILDRILDKLMLKF